MSKFQEPYEDTQQLFNKAITDAGIDQLVNIKILTNNTLKEIGKVVKANELVKHMTNEDVIILVNEDVFEKLETDQKELITEKLVAHVGVDTESGKVTIDKPDFTEFSLVLRKHGFEKCDAVFEAVRAIFAQIAEEEEQQRIAKAAARKRQ